jgi:endonuclease VIII
MPEGPEVKRSADALAKVLQGHRATDVWFCPIAFPALKGLAKTLRGHTIESIQPRGKALLVAFSNGWTIYSHNQLYGQWQVVRRTGNTQKSPPESHLQTRMILGTSSAWAVLYSASDISAWRTNEIHQHPYIAKLGVELLARETKVNKVLEKVNEPRFARRTLGAILNDQSFLAGIGNYLRSDILFVARLAPHHRVGDLPPAARRTLAQAALKVTRQSYRTRGVTNDLALAKILKAQGQDFESYRHWVFAREGLPCRMCDTAIERTDVFGRGLFFCCLCQR